MRAELVSVMVDDQDRALAFYTGMLGFEKKTEIPMGEYRWLTVVSPERPDGPEIVLEPSAHPAANPFRAALKADGLPIIAFAVDDLAATHEALAAKGVTFTTPPTDAGGVKIATLDDTCGNLVQLYQV